MRLKNNSERNEIILEALHCALALLADEYETVINSELKGEYEQTIGKVENAIRLSEKTD